MQFQFKAIRLSHSKAAMGKTDWTVVLTTPEGYDHQVGGFPTAADACSWARRETGQTMLAPLGVASGSD